MLEAPADLPFRHRPATVREPAAVPLPSLSHHFLAGHTLPDDLQQTLLRSASGLHRAAQEHPAFQPLKGRHVAIACRDPLQRAGDAVGSAAASLGAQVSYISADALSFSPQHHGLARMLGSLYDAIDCRELSAERAIELQNLASIPVFDGLADAARPLRALLPAVADADAASEDEKFARLVQAALIETLAC